jgi:inner membrane protein involved in colicin E2 resistance
MFRWMQSITAKVLGIGLLALLMLIPLTQAERLEASAFGVKFYQPGGVYQQNDRAGKYLALGGVLTLVYAILYGLIGAEQYALLIGSVVLVAVIALLMYLTRRIDWYAQGVLPHATTETL